MKTQSILALVLAISLLPGASAFAEGHDRQYQRDHKEQSQRGHPGQGWADEGRWNPPDNRQRGHGAEGRGQGAGPNHNFYRGDRLDRQYRHNNYVVDDWRGHHLSPPPRGYHWVQTGGDYVLVAIATGIITQILLSR